MRSKRVWRHYCDHCKKSGCNSHAITLHERTCFRNPQRHCVVCDKDQDVQAALNQVSDWRSPSATIDQMRQITEGCPACIVAIIILGEFDTPGDEDGPGKAFPFDYKAERRIYDEIKNPNTEIHF